jgi:hypothetical protein
MFDQLNQKAMDNLKRILELEEELKKEGLGLMDRCEIEDELEELRALEGKTQRPRCNEGDGECLMCGA